MKKLQMLALALVIGVSSAFATTTNVEPDPELEMLKKEIRSQISELLDDVDFQVDESKTVNIMFTFSSEGEIVVLKIDSRDRDVVRYVRKHINYKKLDTPGYRDQVYTMPLTIKEA